MKKPTKKTPTSSIPQDAKFHPVSRIRDTGNDCTVKVVNYGGKATPLLSITKEALRDAGIEPGTKVALLRGSAPHHRWIRVEKADYGKIVPAKASLTLSLKPVLKDGLKLKGESVTPLSGGNAVYFELPADWVR